MLPSFSLRKKPWSPRHPRPITTYKKGVGTSTGKPNKKPLHVLQRQKAQVPDLQLGAA